MTTSAPTYYNGKAKAPEAASRIGRVSGSPNKAVHHPQGHCIKHGIVWPMLCPRGRSAFHNEFSHFTFPNVELEFSCSLLYKHSTTLHSIGICLALRIQCVLNIKHVYSPLSLRIRPYRVQFTSLWCFRIAQLSSGKKGWLMLQRPKLTR